MNHLLISPDNLKFMNTNRLQWAAWIVLGGILLSFWGLYNGFPFVYPDTGTYIFTGFSGEVPIDRPLSYGLFIRHSSMRDSLFWVMYAQGILTSALIFLLLRQYVKLVTPPLFIGVILALTACTNISIYVSFLMPDLFTPVFYGSVLLLLLGDQRRVQLIATALLGWLALVMHNSHLLAGTMIVGLLVLASFSGRFRKLVPPKRLLLVGGLVAAGWLSVMSLHYAFGGKFVVQQAAHVFTMARLNEMGLLKPYLDKACAEGKNYPICAFKDSLPEDFLWSSESPAHKDGGWLAHTDEYRAIIRDLLTTPRFSKKYIINALNGTAQQLCYFRAEDMEKWKENTPPYGAVQRHFPHELNNYKFDHQNHRNWYLNFDGLNTRQQYLFFGFILLLVLTGCHPWWRAQVPGPLRHLLVFCAIAILINAFICSTFSTVVSRYQGRLIWLPVLAGFMALYTIRKPLFERIRAGGG